MAVSAVPEQPRQHTVLVFDDDADQDMFVASGHIYPQVDQLPDIGETCAQRAQLIENRDGRLAEITGS